jgi:hypothetical protein
MYIKFIIPFGQAQPSTRTPAPIRTQRADKNIPAGRSFLFSTAEKVGGAR